MARALFIVTLIFSWLAQPRAAHARAGDDLPYPLADAYSTAVRFVHIDRGCKIVDQDPHAAYVTFECAGDDSQVHHGSFELFDKSVQGRKGVRAQVTLADNPHYDELRFMELYERKLRQERGNPAPLPPPPPPPAPKQPPDGGITLSP